MLKNESLVLFHLLDPNHSKERQQQGELPETKRVREKERDGSVCVSVEQCWKVTTEWGMKRGREGKKMSCDSWSSGIHQFWLFTLYYCRQTVT